MRHQLHIKLLGTFQLTYNGEPLRPIRKRVQELFAYLIINRNRPCRRDEIAFLFWSDSTEKQARINLRNLLCVAREEVPDRDSLIRVDADTLQWQPTMPYRLDIEEFEQALTVIAAHDDAHRAALEKAVNLYSADLLKGWWNDWILAERDRLHELHIMALEKLMQLAEQQRDFRAAIRYGYRLLRHERLHEATYRALIRLHRCCGERGLAIQVYERCEQALEKMLDALPSMETRAEFALVV